MTLRTVLFWLKTVTWILGFLGFLFIWNLFAGPQLHVAETLIGLSIAAGSLVFLLLSAGKRLKRREKVAMQAREAKEIAAQAAAEEARRAEDMVARRAAAEAERARKEAEQFARLRKAHQQAEMDREYAAKKEQQEQASETGQGRHESHTSGYSDNTYVGGNFNQRVLSAAKNIVDELIAETSRKEQEKLKDWLKDLLDIRNSDKTYRKKIKMIGANLKQSQALAPVAKVLLIKMKNAWNDLGGPAKWAVGAAGTALVLFGGAGAGITAFGGAVGIPLFVVFGAGGALAGAIIQEFDRRQ